MVEDDPGDARANDAVYRLGGEEFLVILSVSTVEGLAAATDRLGVVVAGLRTGASWPTRGTGVVTISLGAMLVGALGT